MTKLLSAFLLFSISFGRSFAQTSDFQMNLVVLHTQKLIYRGALYWDGPVALVGPGFTYKDFLSVGEDGLSLYYHPSERHKLAVGLSYFGDDEPTLPAIPLKEVKEDYKNQRDSTYGYFLKYVYENIPIFSFSFAIHEDLDAHKGIYGNAKITLFPLPFTSLGIELGTGDKKANQYVYGPEGVSGLGHVDAFISTRFPILPWEGQLIVDFRRTNITQKENQEASYILKRAAHSNVSVLGLWIF